MGRAHSYSGGRISPALRKVVRHLEKYGPTEFEELCSIGAQVVLPSQAVRRYLRTRRSDIEISAPIELQVRSGSRWIVMDSIRQSARRDRLRIYVTPDGTEIVVLMPLGGRVYLGAETPRPKVHADWRLIAPYQPVESETHESPIAQTAGENI